MSKYVLPTELLPYLQDPKTIIPHGELIIQRNWITYNDLLYIYTKYITPQNLELHTLLRNLEFYKPRPPESQYTKDFRAQLDQLSAKLDEKAYQSLISKTKLNSTILTTTEEDQDEDANLTPAQIQKKLNEQLTTILNIFISVASVVYALWYWTRNYNNLSYRVLLCLAGGILVLVADVVVYNAFMRKMKDARLNEGRKNEMRRVVDTVVFGGGKETKGFMESKKGSKKKG